MTPSQTIGPFFSHALPWAGGERAVPAGTPGAVWLRGRVLDGVGDPVPDALVETWQTDPAGFARSATSAEGVWAVYVVPPAEYLAVSVFARGLLGRLATRVYFADPPPLADVPESRRDTLVARQADDGYAFDIRLQGEHETVFFAL